MDDILPIIGPLNGVDETPREFGRVDEEGVEPVLFDGQKAVAMAVEEAAQARDRDAVVVAGWMRAMTVEIVAVGNRHATLGPIDGVVFGGEDPGPEAGVEQRCRNVIVGAVDVER